MELHNAIRESIPAGEEERHSRLAGDGSGQHCLSCSRTTGEQDAFREFTSQRSERRGVFEEFDDIFQLLRIGKKSIVRSNGSWGG
jgi:hypothetical protein